jgi:hypothetical protein
MTRQANLKRRHFLLTAGVGGVSAAAAAVAMRAPAEPPPATETVAEPERDGYRLTEHVASYYRTARV